MGWVEENGSVLYLTMHFIKHWLETYVLEHLRSPSGRTLGIIQPHPSIHRAELALAHLYHPFFMSLSLYP